MPNYNGGGWALDFLALLLLAGVPLFRSCRTCPGGGRGREAGGRGGGLDQASPGLCPCIWRLPGGGATRVSSATKSCLQIGRISWLRRVRLENPLGHGNFFRDPN
jgi:hypothetical protein